MSLSIISNDNLFKAGILALFSAGFVDEYFIIIDMETVLSEDFKKLRIEDKQLVVFISNDIDYYALQGIDNVLFIDRKRKPNEIFAFLVANDMRYHYKIKNTLSRRELQILDFMLKGLDACEITLLTGLKHKTFYVHRRNIVLKLSLNNRISLYSDIARLKNHSFK